MNIRYHTPVLVDECIEGLNIRPGGIYLDGTLGGGGHFKAIAEKLGNDGILIGIDRDPDSIACVRNLVAETETRIITGQSEFSGFDGFLDANGIDRIDGFLLDLGVSSHQIDAPERGFSYLKDGPLDMRMNRAKGRPASDLIASLTAEELAEMFREYGEVENPRRLARVIFEKNRTSAIQTTGDFRNCLLAEYGSVSMKLLSKSFQALRIAVNGELDQLRLVLDKAVNRLRIGGRLVVISYHSLEDRIVKNFFRTKENGCICPREIPMCVCGKTAILKRVNRKSIRPSDLEIAANRRARSARLRVAEMIV
jgi:16S rRNA (cytosine1402-N4)-methyltransferase